MPQEPKFYNKVLGLLKTSTASTKVSSVLIKGLTYAALDRRVGLSPAFGMEPHHLLGLWGFRNLEGAACNVNTMSTFISFSKTDHSGLTCRDTGCRVIQGWLLGVFAEVEIYIHTHM